MKVRVTREITIRVSDVANVRYPAGFEGTAPRAHIAQIEAAGAGERLAGNDPDAPDAETSRAEATA